MTAALTALLLSSTVLQDHAGHDAEPRSLLDEIPRAREASGTAWQPDSTPMHALHFTAGDWSFMVHGNVFLGYDDQSGPRGAEEAVGINWFMLMADRPLGDGRIGFRAMFSLEPWTAGDDGYPLLFQSGELHDGEPIHDRQHPHDLFMELAAEYVVPLGPTSGLHLYAAPAGEPALGPVAAPHRASASSDPLAPLSHHWQDATHISYGVVTGGLFTRHAKLEASWFNGVEPDEDRTDFDFEEFRSYSVRLSVNPAPDWSGQVSYGFLDGPERAEPGTDVRRVTASLTYNLPLDGGGNLAATAVWGRNDPTDGRATDSFLVEADWNLDGRHTVFGRAEYVLKGHHDLALDHSYGEDPFGIASLVLGYAYSFAPVAGLTPSVGVRFSVNFADDNLDPVYGDEQTYGVMIYVRLSPARAESGAHAH